MCESVAEAKPLNVTEFPKLQRQIVRQANREAASLLSIEALAKQIVELSSGTASPEKLEHIQQYAEAMMYNIEDTRERLGRLAASVNDMSAG
ncbi:hypothetical protein [Vibrio sp. H11]|uniref:hypothetical protein n=1 Tax=Vibrio sp. H11 TaxID=2565928 RepID=UPI0010A61EB7|nr:hypothetical protein [Vibrio sp. H11]